MTLGFSKMQISDIAACGGIGSTRAGMGLHPGAGVELYVQELERLQQDPYELWQAEVAAPSGFGRILLHYIQQTIAEHPSPTVSHHLHLCLVRRGEIRLLKSDHTFVPPGGPEIEVRMPKVASTWSEFVTMCEDSSVKAAQAVC